MTRYFSIRNSMWHSLGLEKKYKNVYLPLEKTVDEFRIDEDVLILVDAGNDNLSIIKSLLDRGAKFIYNNLWEYYDDNTLTKVLLPYSENGLFLKGKKPSIDDTLLFKTIYVPMFFWFTEVVTQEKKPLIKSIPNKKFLMPINRDDLNRRLLVEKLNQRLDDAIYSFVAKGKRLPDDQHEFNDRYFNSKWYENTGFSLVVESLQLVNGGVFITEKTFKPISTGHPFLLFGCKNSLPVLRENGFLTYDELFKEYYDLSETAEERIKLLLLEIDNFDANKIPKIYDKLKYNYDHFYNIDLVKARIKNEIELPIKKWLNEQ